MKLAEFIRSSGRTLANKFSIDSEIKINLLHSAIGISTEVGEIVEAFNKNELLDIVNLAEEAADVIWYMAIPIRDYELDISKLDLAEVTEFNLEKLVIDSANFLDYIKKISFYNKKIETTEVDKHVINIYSNIISMAHFYGLDLELALSNNQDKLKARFPDKYDDSKALNRNTDTERAELEKGM